MKKNSRFFKVTYVLLLVVITSCNSQESSSTSSENTMIWSEKEKQQIIKKLPELIPFQNKEGKLGFVNQHMEEVIQCKYDWLIL